MSLYWEYSKYANDVNYFAHNEDGRCTLTVALTCSLYFWNGHTQPVREGLIECFERFEQIFKGKLNWVMPPENLSVRAQEVKIDHPKLPKFRNYVQSLGENDSIAWYVSGGKNAEEACDCFMGCLVNAKWWFETYGDMSYIHFAIPILADTPEQTNLKLFQEFVNFCCSRLHPVNGLAGVSSIIPYNSGQYQGDELELQNRYYGLNVMTTDYRQTEKIGLKTTSWLTILGPEMQQQAREKGISLDTAWQAEPRIRQYKLGETLVIQAGAEPRLAPVTKAKPEPYKKVNDVLKPLRVKEACLHIGTFSNQVEFDTPLSTRWLTRLDDDGQWPAFPDWVNYHGVDESISDELTGDEPPIKESIAVKIVPDVGVGDICPASGMWYCKGVSPETGIYMRKGDIMPGQSYSKEQRETIVWTLIKPIENT
jgi:hypothetical protein